jgi:hypothetical protein
MAGCGGNSKVVLPTAVQSLVDVGKQSSWMTEGNDPWEGFVCHVPADTKSPVYAGLPLRRDLSPEPRVRRRPQPQHMTTSRGKYRPAQRQWRGPRSPPTTNADLRRQRPRSLSERVHGVLVVADAEHCATSGRARPLKGVCPARASSRDDWRTSARSAKRIGVIGHRWI